MIKVINSANFESEVLSNKKKVVLDFWATWCGPCRMLSPIIDEIAEEKTDIVFGKVNVDEEPMLADKFSVSSIPTVVVIDGGRVTAVSVGYVEKNTLIAKLGI